MHFPTSRTCTVTHQNRYLTWWCSCSLQQNPASHARRYGASPGAIARAATTTRVRNTRGTHSNEDMAGLPSARLDRTCSTLLYGRMTTNSNEACSCDALRDRHMKPRHDILESQLSMRTWQHACSIVYISPRGDPMLLDLDNVDSPCASA